MSLDLIKNSIRQKPAYEGEDGLIYCADCLEIMPQMPDGCVDLVVTDPPYGVRNDQEWEEMDRAKFAAFSMRWLPETKRLGSALIVFDSGYSCLRGLCELLWIRVRQMIWDKILGSQYAGASEAGLFFAHETIFHCYKPHLIAQPKTLVVAGMIRAARESIGLSRGGVDMIVSGKKTGLCYRWEEAACLPTLKQVEKLKTFLSLPAHFDEALNEAYSKKTDNIGAKGRDVFSHRTVLNPKHPCQKPDGLLLDIVSLLSKPKDLILDPFLGSGTTAVAAKQLGRKFVGIDISSHYINDIAIPRLRQEVMKL